MFSVTFKENISEEKNPTSINIMWKHLLGISVFILIRTTTSQEESGSEEPWHGKYEKTFPGRIPGPKKLTDFIGIIGAGPSGIHMAYLLKKRGFKNVKILEASNQIGK